MSTRVIPLAFSVLMAAAALTGCNGPSSLSSDLKKKVDMGTTALENGYALHGYRIDLEGDNPHYVYVLERDGTPVAGTATNRAVSAGKNSSRNLSVSSVVGPNLGDGCGTIEDCQAKLAALRQSRETQEALLAELQRQYKAEQAARAK